MKIAHLTDLHLDGSTDRRNRFLSALGKAAAADWLVLTGDLTASGTVEQQEELAGVLHHYWARGCTLVQGNHDGKNFELQRFVRFLPTSQPGVGVPISPEVTIVPLNTFSRRRSFLFSAIGTVEPSHLRGVASLAPQVILAMHHGPQRDPLAKFASLRNAHLVNALLEQHPNVHVLCGHDHRVRDIGRIRVAAACGFHADPLRMYEADARGVWPIYQSGCEGSIGNETVCEAHSRQ